VQDAAAALPARLLGGDAGETALTCARAGRQDLQLAAAARVTLSTACRPLRRVTAGLERTGLAAETVVADARAGTTRAG